jgi:hypothetical protein
MDELFFCSHERMIKSGLAQDERLFLTPQRRFEMTRKSNPNAFDHLK